MKIADIFVDPNPPHRHSGKEVLDSGAANACPICQARTIAKLTSERDRLRKALQILYDETADYIRVNHLGDIHHNQSMKTARDALKGTK